MANAASTQIVEQIGVRFPNGNEHWPTGGDGRIEWDGRSWFPARLLPTSGHKEWPDLQEAFFNKANNTSAFSENNPVPKLVRIKRSIITITLATEDID